MARIIFVIALITAVFIGCAPDQSPAEKLAAENKATTENVYRLFVEDDWEALENYFARDFIDHNPDPGQEPGFEGVKSAFRETRKGFPDFNIIVLHMMAEGDYVFSRVEFTGTHTGEYLGIPPTGRQVSIELFDLVRIVDGKAVERWGVVDSYDFLLQLGVIEPPAM